MVCDVEMEKGINRLTDRLRNGQKQSEHDNKKREWKKKKRQRILADCAFVDG